jgi:hypothetical protein
MPPACGRLVGSATITARARRSLPVQPGPAKACMSGRYAVNGHRGWSAAKDHELSIPGWPRHQARQGGTSSRTERALWRAFRRSQCIFAAKSPDSGQAVLVARRAPLNRGLVAEVAAKWVPVKTTPRQGRPTPSDSQCCRSRGCGQRRAPGSIKSSGHTTWDVVERNPMILYLATATIGQFRVHAYVVRRPAILYDAVWTGPLCTVAIRRTGSKYAFSQLAQKLVLQAAQRTIAVPAGGGHLSFWIDRDTNRLDFGFRRGAHPGTGRWTTFARCQRAQSQDVGPVLPQRLVLGCTPSSGTTRSATDEGL